MLIASPATSSNSQPAGVTKHRVKNWQVSCRRSHGPRRKSGDEMTRVLKALTAELRGGEQRSRRLGNDSQKSFREVEEWDDEQAVYLPSVGVALPNGALQLGSTRVRPLELQDPAAQDRDPGLLCRLMTGSSSG